MSEESKQASGWSQRKQHQYVRREQRQVNEVRNDCSKSERFDENYGEMDKNTENYFQDDEDMDEEHDEEQTKEFWLLSTSKKKSKRNFKTSKVAKNAKRKLFHLKILKEILNFKGVWGSTLKLKRFW